METKAKKNLGQNFLHDPNIKAKIKKLLEIHYQSQKTPQLPIIEIGPGLGDLSELIEDIPTKITLIEIDDDLIPKLESKFPNIKIINDDFMNLLPNIESSYLFSNLPYYIGSRLIVDLIGYNQRMPFGFILQKEVVFKTKTSSKITFFGAILSLFYDIKIELSIPPSAFRPSPKVYSSLFFGNPKDLDFDGLLSINILKAMFFKPNKILYNNLIFGGFDKEEVENIFKHFEFDKNTRVNWSNYKEIFEKIYRWKSI
ncbi:MAG: ribosomal RNA small subunit methyltransferase A [Patescibacteria group bacterium]